MAKVLTEASDIKCAHSPGAVTAATKKSTAKLTVQGKAVLLSGQESSWQISGCTQTDASSSQTPCLTVTLSGAPRDRP